MCPYYACLDTIWSSYPYRQPVGSRSSWGGTIEAQDSGTIEAQNQAAIAVIELDFEQQYHYALREVNQNRQSEVFKYESNIQSEVESEHNILAAVYTPRDSQGNSHHGQGGVRHQAQDT